MPAETPNTITSLQQQVADLSHEVRFLKSKIDSLAPNHSPPPHVDATIISDVLEFTRSLFEGEVQIEEREDPEYPSDPYAMLYAQTTLPEDEIGRRQKEWHKSVRKVARGMHRYFRLCVEVR